LLILIPVDGNLFYITWLTNGDFIVIVGCRCSVELVDNLASQCHTLYLTTSLYSLLYIHIYLELDSEPLMYIVESIPIAENT
jgi:hypothetical protein